MITLERPPIKELSVDRVAKLDYSAMMDEAQNFAGQIGVDAYLCDKSLELLDDLHRVDTESALGGLRTMPIALEVAEVITDFYGIEFDESNVWASALLHDIGKKELPIELLRKSSDGLEWTQDDAFAMRRHAVLGGVLLRLAEMPQTVIRAVEEHHHKQLGGNEYGVDMGLNNQERICRDVVAVADFAEADLNRTNSRNFHLNRKQREEQIAEDVAYVFNDYDDGMFLANAVFYRIVGS